MGVVSESLLLTAPRSLAWLAEHLPPLRPGEILVRTTSSAISVASELATYRGSLRASQPPTYPLMTGYESVGEVIECGEAVEAVSVGDRIVASYGHRTHAAIDAARAICIPAAVPDALALLSILSCDVEKGLRRVSPHPADRVLITGMGTMGLLAVFLLRARGLQQIDVVEPEPVRRELALRLGARRALSPAEAAALDSTYPMGVECSDRDAAFHLLQQRAAPGGRICVLADGNLEPLTLAPDFHAKELQVLGSSNGWDYPAHAAWYFEHLRRQPAPLDALFDLRIRPADLPTTFAALDAGHIHPIKVLVEYPPA